MLVRCPKSPTAEAENLTICLTLSGTKGFSVLISDLVPDLHLIGDAQCFPLYLYEETSTENELMTYLAMLKPTQQMENILVKMQLVMQV